MTINVRKWLLFHQEDVYCKFSEFNNLVGFFFPLNTHLFLNESVLKLVSKPLQVNYFPKCLFTLLVSGIMKSTFPSYFLNAFKF